MKNLLTPLFTLLITFSLSAQEKPPEIQDDYYEAIAGMEFTIRPMENDFGMNGHDIIILHVTGYNCEISFNDSLVIVTPEMYYKDTLVIEYRLKDNTNGLLSLPGSIYINVINNSFDELNINNIEASIMGWGNHFYLPAQDENPYFSVPAGSDTYTMFNMVSWVAGLDQDSVYHVAAERYRQLGTDFHCGPVADNYDSNYYAKWNKVWKLSKSEIDHHRNNWWKTGYTPIENIATWPGVLDNISKRKIAPFHDHNSDGIYNAMDGDYPYIKGTQCIFFVYNDMKEPHTESDGAKLGIEIHGMAYAFECPGDSVLNNTIFFNYKINNLSDTTYYDTKFGIFADIDLGCPWDDYSYTDVYRNSIVGYNGTEYDGNGWCPEEESFLDHPAAQSVTLLSGPYLDADSEDNARFDNQGNLICGEGIIGKNFQDGIVDNERFGIGNTFILGNYINQYYDPTSAEGYHNMLSSKWSNGEELMYGSGGNIPSGAVGPACKYMYPSDSDTNNWGTDCNYPNGGFNTNNLYWNENTVMNIPDDRHTIIGTGGFTFKPGDIQEMDIALVFARYYSLTGVAPSVELLKIMIDKVQFYFDNDSTPCGAGSFSNITKREISGEEIEIYPNPASDYINLYNPEKLTFEYCIIDLTGKEIQTGKIDKENEIVNISGLRSGLYFIKSIGSDAIFCRKLVVR